jgi:acyl carrier protein
MVYNSNETMDMVSDEDALLNLLSTLFVNQVSNQNLREINLFNDLAMDSIAFITMVIEIEALFTISIPDELLAFSNFDSFNSIIQTIKTIKYDNI